MSNSAPTPSNPRQILEIALMKRQKSEDSSFPAAFVRPLLRVWAQFDRENVNAA
jgi:hypothetical protein